MRCGGCLSQHGVPGTGKASRAAALPGVGPPSAVRSGSRRRDEPSSSHVRCNVAGGGMIRRRFIFSGAVSYFPAGRCVTARRFTFPGAVIRNGAPFHIFWRRDM